MPELLLPGRDLADQPLAEGEQLGQLAPGGVGCWRRRRPGKRPVPRDHLGIDPVSLGQAAARPGAVAHPLGVDDRDLKAALEQVPMRQALVAPDASITTSVPELAQAVSRAIPAASFATVRRRPAPRS